MRSGALFGEVHRFIPAASTIFTKTRTISPKLRLVYGDLTDGGNLSALLNDIKPDEVYNLGAQSHVRVSFDQPIYTANVDALGTLRVLEAIRMMASPPNSIRPRAAKCTARLSKRRRPKKRHFIRAVPTAVQKYMPSGRRSITARRIIFLPATAFLFNHESPRRGETFVTRKITRAATRIKLGLQKKLYLGNLDAKRDWGFAGDYVEAMWLMMQQEKPDDFVIATGETHSVREFLDEVFGYLDLDWQKYVEVDPRYYRPTEVDLLLGDREQGQKSPGLAAKITFKALAKMMTDADMKIARHEKLIADSDRH